MSRRHCGALARKGIRITTSTIVDVTIIYAPSSTKNKSGERDREMHQTRKVKQWYFASKRTSAWTRRKASCTRYARPRRLWRTSICCPTYCMTRKERVWGDGGYQGQTETIRKVAPHAQDMTCRRTRFKNYVDEVAKRKNTTKSRVKAKVEHSFRIFGLPPISAHR